LSYAYNFKYRENKYRIAARAVVIFSLLFLAADYIYKTYNGIQFHTRGRCILYRNLPEWGFVLFENVFELGVVTVSGIFISAVTEKIFSRYKKWFPKNPFTAFAYASLFPMCGCSAVFFISGMRSRLDTKTIITFVLASPLLSPYLVFLSLSLIGLKYTVLRIISAFLITIITGFIIELFEKNNNAEKPDFTRIISGGKNCEVKIDDIFIRTLMFFKKITPYLLFSSVVNIILYYYKPLQGFELSSYLGNVPGILSMMLLGLPMYLCNGAEIIFLQPLIYYAELPLGTAIAFSITSTSVCFTSAAVSFKILGKKLTLLMIASVFTLTFIIGILINLFINN